MREIAESDYHFDAQTVGAWTPYQFRMYVCPKGQLKGRKEFGTLAEARAYASEIKQQRLPQLPKGG